MKENRIFVTAALCRDATWETKQGPFFFGGLLTIFNINLILTIMKTANTQTWGVFKIPTREGRIFAGMKEELVSTPVESQQEALDLAADFRMSGYYDELTSTYTAKPIKN